MKILNRFLYKTRKFYGDDFDWDTYTETSYARRLKVVDKDYSTIAPDGTLTFDPETGSVGGCNPPLHPNIVLLLEAIGQLQPASVHEVGCGGGDHVSNGSRLYPEIRYSGSDRSQGQLDLLHERHPNLKADITLQDLTMPYSENWPRADLVYSQAVIMHIHTAVSHLVALSNMFRMADKYVLLVENILCHDFVAEIQGLHAGGHTGWDALHLYQFKGSAGSWCILASKEPLDYTPLKSDAQIREGVPPSDRLSKRAKEDFERATFGPANA
ncbi:MAG: class I SAM-dependent methyltransferase [Pseudomonadota bacterium]